MKKRNLLIGGLFALSITACAFGVVACSGEPPKEEVPVITERVRYTDETNPYAELEWQEFQDIDDWNDKLLNAPVYYQFEGSYSEAYQGNYSRDFLYMNCYEDGSVFGSVNGSNSECYYGYWTNVNSRGKEILVLHILLYNGKEYNQGMGEIVCDTQTGSYYDFASNIALDKWGNQRTMSISGYRYSPVKSLTVSGGKTEYTIGDDFTTKGLTVTVNRENGKSIAIDEESFGKSDCRVSFAGYDKATPGAQDITVTYLNTEIKTTYKVNVYGLTGIKVDASAGKTKYHLGDSFESTGIVVSAMRDNGTEGEIDHSRCEFSGFDASEPVEGQEISVKLKGTDYTTTYDIQVFGVKSFEIDASNVQKEYYVGDKLNTEGIVLNATFLDEATSEVNAKLCEFSGFDSSAAAESQTITVSFGGIEKTYNVKITAPVFNGKGKIDGASKDISIKINTPEACELKYDSTTLNLNYTTMSVGNLTVYNLVKTNSVDDATWGKLPKQYVLDKSDLSLSTAMIYEIPSNPQSVRAEQEPMPDIGGNTEQRYIILDEENGQATLTYKYWYAGQTDTFVMKYTLENGVLTFTELVEITAIGGGGANFEKMYKTWTLNADFTAVKYTPPQA